MILSLLLALQSVTVSQPKVVPEKPETAWEANEQQDGITDERRCFVLPSIFNGKTRPDTAIIVVPNRIYISNGTDVYPRSQQAIRVDGGKPVFWIEGQETVARSTAARQVIGQLRKPGPHSVTIQWVNWPYNTKRTETFDPGNMVEAIDKCLAWVKSK